MELTDNMVDQLEHLVWEYHWSLLHKENKEKLWGGWLKSRDIMVADLEDLKKIWNKYPNHLLIENPANRASAQNFWNFLLIPKETAEKLLILGF